MSSLHFTPFCLHLDLPKVHNKLSEIIKFYRIREMIFTGCGRNMVQSISWKRLLSVSIIIGSPLEGCCKRLETFVG